MMAGFTEPLSNGDPPSDGGLSTLIQEVDQLSLYVNDFQDHIDLELLVPRLIEHRIVTNAEIYDLQNGAKAPESRILSLITIILPRKGRNVLEKFKLALKDTVNQDGSQGHQELLQKYFAVYPDVHLYSGSGKVQPTAHTISDESEAFSILLIKIRKIMESGNEKEVTQRLKDVANYLCFIQVEAKNKQHKVFLLKESVRAELCSTDLSFSKLFHCLSSSNPPVISYSDISMLHKIIKTLEIVEDNKKMIERLKQLLHKYEEDAGIILSAVNPQVQNDCARIKAKVTNASSGGPKLKNGVKKSLFQSFWLGFRGSGVGSVIFYWDFPEEYILRVKDGLDNACNNKTELHQLKITRVKAQLDQKPYQIDLDMEITDPVLLEAAQKQHLVADDIAPEQEKFVLLLLKIGHLIGTCAELFLSTSRRELPRSYAQFERNSFKEMTGSLIFENKLHCYDISFIQQFLLSLLKWDTSQGSKNKELIIGLLKDTQEYEPVPTVSPLPSIQLNYKSNTVTAVTNFFDVYFVNYEVMMTLKYTLLQLLYLSPSAFQYVSWKKLNKGCQITWKTSSENFERIENKLRYHQSTAALTTCNDFEIDYPYKITFSCNIINRQILLDGSPLLCPDLEGKILIIIIVLCT